MILAAFFALQISFMIVLISIPAHQINRLKVISLCGSFGVFLYSIFFWIFFNPLTSKFQYTFSLTWFHGYPLIFGLDALSLVFVMLSTLLTPCCLLCIFHGIYKKIKEIILLFIFLELLLTLLFSTLDLGLFYIFFESILIPMFLLIGFWGSNRRKIVAAYLFFLFTLVGSLLMLATLLFLYSKTASLNYYTLVTTTFSEIEQLFLWPGLFIACAVKVPMFPVHGWLPEAHVEAPTAGSVLLAGILLKIGVYAIFRFIFPMLPYGTIYYSPLVNAFALIGALYAALIALRQIDLKKIIAYSSIAHMNFGLFGIFTLKLTAIHGALLLMLAHGFVSSALFILVGVIYDRYKIRLLSSLTGLTQLMPLFSIYFFMFSLANLGFPGTFNFVSEYLIIVGLAGTNLFILLISCFPLFFTTCFGIWLYTRVAFGALNHKIQYYVDLTLEETINLSILLVPTILFGLFPNSLCTLLQNFLLNTLAIFY